MRILLIEDDEKLGGQVADQLTSSGYSVEWLQRGDVALEADPAHYALIVLDLMLPGAFGLDILKEYRRRSDTPIMVLSAKQDATTKVRALELGADDYVTKPFWPEELDARITARIRRPVLQRGETIDLGRLTLGLETRVVEVDHSSIELTRVEFDLLANLARRAGAVVSRDDLAVSVLDPDKEGTGRTLDVHVSRLRKKLGPCSSQLRTIWGVGYRLDTGS